MPRDRQPSVFEKTGYDDFIRPQGRCDASGACCPRGQACESLADRPRPGRAGAALVAAAIVPERQAKMRAQQLWHWLYVRGVSDFAHMFNISKDLRAALDVHFTIARPEIVEEQVSNDGTRKWLFRFPPRGAGRPVEIETVYIPEEGRGTLCISSPGRLHADLLVLPYRHAEAGAQPDRRGDPDAADDGARQARRFPRPRHAGRGDRAGRRPQDLQHRHDGHGRAALQFRGSEEGAADRLGRRRAVAVEAAHHAFHLGRRA